MRLLGMLRCIAALKFVGLALAGVWLMQGCGTGADGVSQCRTIEAARCRAAVACELVADLDLCLRYTRDHCLHGTATGGTPPPGDVRDCVEMLERAGSCAADSKEMDAEDCPRITLIPGLTATTDVCDVIQEPELTTDCSFLMPVEVEEEEPPPAPEDAGSDGG
jgi:hypothetical protein